MVLGVVVNILHELHFISFEILAVLLILMAMGLVFISGIHLREEEIEQELKQQKRTEHDRIARLINTDNGEPYEQNMESNAYNARTRKPF